MCLPQHETVISAFWPNGGLDVFEFVFAEHSGNPSPFPLIMYANVDPGVVVAGSSVLTTAFVVSTDAVVGTVVVVTSFCFCNSIFNFNFRANSTPIVFAD